MLAQTPFRIPSAAAIEATVLDDESTEPVAERSTENECDNADDYSELAHANASDWGGAPGPCIRQISTQEPLGLARPPVRPARLAA